MTHIIAKGKSVHMTPKNIKKRTANMGFCNSGADEQRLNISISILLLWVIGLTFPDFPTIAKP
jgi:hypothetical protein